MEDATKEVGQSAGRTLGSNSSAVGQRPKSPKRIKCRECGAQRQRDYCLACGDFEEAR